MFCLLTSMFKMLSTFLCFLFGLIRRAQAGIESLSFRLAVKVFYRERPGEKEWFWAWVQRRTGLGFVHSHIGL